MSTAISLAAVPTPSDKESEISDAIDARQKLHDAIEDQKQKREAAATDLAKTFAKSIRLLPVVDVEAAFQKNEAWRTADERAQQRSEALQSLLEKVYKLIDQLKTDDPDAVHSVLSSKLESLEKALLEKEVAEKDLDSQIKQLRAEINKLPKNNTKKA